MQHACNIGHIIFDLILNSDQTYCKEAKRHLATLVLIAQAAKESSYTPDHIRLLLRKGTIAGEKIGGTWLVDLDDLKRYEQEMEELGSKKFDPTKGET